MKEGPREDGLMSVEDGPREGEALEASAKGLEREGLEGCGPRIEGEKWGRPKRSGGGFKRLVRKMRFIEGYVTWNVEFIVHIIKIFISFMRHMYSRKRQKVKQKCILWEL